MNKKKEINPQRLVPIKHVICLPPPPPSSPPPPPLPWSLYQFAQNAVCTCHIPRTILISHPCAHRSGRNNIFAAHLPGNGCFSQWMMSPAPFLGWGRRVTTPPCFCIEHPQEVLIPTVFPVNWGRGEPKTPSFFFSHLDGKLSASTAFLLTSNRYTSPKGLYVATTSEPHQFTPHPVMWALECLSHLGQNLPSNKKTYQYVKKIMEKIMKKSKKKALLV